MCKLFIVAGKLTQTQARQLLANASSTFAPSQRDGFGFVAYGDNGAVCRGRYFDPETYPGFKVPLPKFIAAPTQIEEEGEMPKIITAMVIHGRTSTNNKSLANCHPFRNQGVHLAHNGVLHWKGTGPRPAAQDNCDSDAFLTWLLEPADGTSPWRRTHKDWGGYGVFGIIDLARACLTVAKDDTGRLAWMMTTKGTHLFTTEKHDFSSLLKATNLRPIAAAIVKPKTISEFRITGDRAEFIETYKWKGFAGYAKDESFHKSYGAQGVTPIGGGYDYRQGNYERRYGKGAQGAFKDDADDSLEERIEKSLVTQTSEVRTKVREEDRADSDGMKTKAATSNELPILTTAEAEDLMDKAMEGLEAELNSEYLKQPGVTTVDDATPTQSKVAG